MAAAGPIDSIDLDQLCSSEADLKPFAEQELQRLKTEISRDGYRTPPPRFELLWTNYVVLSGLPKVGLEKLDKLTNVLVKVIGKLGIHLETSNIAMPMDGETTASVAFLTCPSEDTAKEVIKGCNGLQFDKQHRLVACSFDEFDRLLQLPETYEQPTVFSKADLMSWLTDPAGRDQFILRYDTQTSVYWNDSVGRQPEAVLTPGLSAERYVAWSGSGTYLATMSAFGVILWAGSSFQEVKRFAHTQVSHLEFSPCDRYLLTFSSSKTGTLTIDVFTVWSVFSGQELRTFRTNNESWGAFKWSHSGNFLAKISEGMISVYQSEDMQLLADSKGNKTSIKVPDIKSFMWSPGADVLTYFVAGEADISRIKLMELPSRREMYSKTLTQATRCDFSWQGEGQFLCAVTTRVNKAGKTLDSNLELIFVKEKDIPAYLLQVNRVITHFAWEARGRHFSILVQADHGHELRVYKLNLEASTAEPIATLETQATEVFWAPSGGHFVLCNRAKGLTPPGSLEFFSVKGKSIHCLNSHFHSGLTHVEWDPAGLHLLSSTRQTFIAGGTGNSSTYAIWTCQGQSIFSTTEKNLYQVLWRPRPLQVLPIEKQAEAEARAQHQAQNYLENDRVRIERKKQMENDAKNKQREVLMEHMLPFQERWRHTEDSRAAVLGYTDAQEAARWRVNFVEVETILKTKSATSGSTKS